MGPGFEIADGYVAVLPDTSGFAARLTRELGGLAPVDIRARIDTDALREQMRRELGEGGRRAGEDAGRRINEGAQRESGPGRWRSFGVTLATGIVAGIASIGIGKALLGSITAASDLNETISKTNVVFGDAAVSVLALGDAAASSLGQSRTQALEAASTMGNLFVSMGLAQGQAAGMSTSMVRLASDFASFNNASPEEALDAIKAALIGENDPIQRFGVNLNAATVQAYALSSGLASSKAAITPAIQAQAAYALILQQSGTAQGDFARTSGGAANQSRILRATLSDLSAQAGTVLLPAVNRVLGGLTGFAARIPELTSGLRERFGPGLNTASLGLRGLFGAMRDGEVSSTGFVGVMERIGSGVRSTATTVGGWLLPSLRNLGAFVRESVWPTLKDLANVFTTSVLPALKDVGKVAGVVVLVAFRVLSVLLRDVVGPVLRAVAGFVRDNQVWLATLAVAVGAGVTAWYAYRGAVVAVTTAQWLWQTRTLLMGAASRAVTGGLAAMRAGIHGVNMAMRANMIGIIITAIIALAAAFAYAYTHSETFRRIVDAVLNAVRTAFTVTIGFIVGFVQRWWPYLIGILTGGIGLAVVWVIRHWDDIKHVFSSVTDWLIGFVKQWWPYLLGLVTGPIGLAVGMVIRHWDSIKGAFSAALNWIKDRIVLPVMGAIETGIDRSLGAIKGFFSGAVTGIKAIWNGLKEVAAAPVRFVVETVYNKGIRWAWNNIVARIPGVPDMPALVVPGLAAGGPVVGGTRGRDSVLRLLAPDEHVWTEREVANAGGHRGVFALRRLFGGGTQSRGPGMFWGGDALGAAWDATGGAVASKLEELARAGISRGFELVLGPLRTAIDATLGTRGDWKGVLGKLAQAPMGKLLDWVRGKDAETSGAGAGGGGAGVERWRAVALRALSLTGQASSWIGLLLKRMNQESGGSPTIVNRQDSNWKAGTPSVGLLQVIAPTFRAYAGAYRNTGPFSYGVSTDPLANIYASIRYTLSRYGSLSAWARPGGYAKGGVPPLGVPFWVGEDGPELLTLGRAGPRGTVTPAGAAGTNVTNHFYMDRSMSTPEVLAEMRRQLALAVA